MRRLHGVRKMIVVEEAWKAIAREGMADYIKFLCAPVKVASKYLFGKRLGKCSLKMTYHQPTYLFRENLTEQGV